MDVKALQARLAAFAAERGWDEVQNPRNLAIAIAGEAGMLLDLFRWLTDAESQRIESEYKREAAEEAIADLLLHTLRVADRLGIDVERAVARKLAENDANYPLPMAAPAPEAVPAPVPVRQEAPQPTPPKQTVAPALPVEPQPGPKAASPSLPEAKKVPPPEEKKAPPLEGKKAPPPEEKKAPPLEGKKAPPPEERKAPRPEPVGSAPTPEAEDPQPAPESPKPAPDKALPSWLDGILPARGATARKKPAAAPRPDPEPPQADAPLRAPEPPPVAARPEPAKAAPPPPPVAPIVEAIDAAPPPAADEPEPVERTPGESPWEPERYEHLDTDAAKGFVKSLAKRVDGARSDDPLLRELHDEVETLRRTLYSPTPKRSWMGDSLKTIRAILEEAATHSVGEELRARDYIAQIDRMLNPAGA